MDDRRKKRLLIIVPTLCMGGQERIAVNTVDLLRNDYDITLAVFDSRDAFYTANCEMIDLNIPATSNVVSRILHAILRAKALRKLKKAYQIDISFSLGQTANLANVLSAGHGKTVCVLHHYDQVSKNPIDMLIYRKSDRIGTCAAVIADTLCLLHPQYASKVFALPNPYDIEGMIAQGAESVSDYSFSPHTIIFHARLDLQKNHSRLIRAFSLVKETYSDAKLLIVGDGPLKNKLEKLVARYHLQDSVTFLGMRKNPFAYLNRSTLYVLPSYSEGFPNSLIEGMCFLPVVAVDCKSGPREILSDGPRDAVCSGVEIADYGILVKPAADREWHDEITEDDRLLAEGIRTLLGSDTLYGTLKKKARDRVESFSYAAYRDRLLRIFEE